MTPSNSTALATKLEDRANGEGQGGQLTLREILAQNKVKFQESLGKQVDVERFLRIVVTTCQKTPKLMECSADSILAAALVSAQLNLEPGPLQEAWLIPRGRECNFQIGYRGYVTLFARAGVNVIVRKVCENDFFDFWTDENGDHLQHKPMLGDRGPVTCYYGLAHLPNGHRVAHVMTLEDIDRHRKKSQMPNSGPWKEDRDAMSCKTVILDMERWIPKSVQVADALEIERRNEPLSFTDDSVQPAELVEGDQPAIDAGSEWDDEPEGEPKEALI